MNARPWTAFHARAICPLCRARMVIRVNRQDHSTFLGCTKHPACKGTIAFPRMKRGLATR